MVGAGNFKGSQAEESQEGAPSVARLLKLTLYVVRQELEASVYVFRFRLFRLPQLGDLSSSQAVTP